MLFSKATKTGIHGIKRSIQLFCATSGQQVNFTKSQLLTSKNMSAHLVMNICTELGIKPMDEHTSYLRLPLPFRSQPRKIFSALLDRLKGW